MNKKVSTVLFALVFAFAGAVSAQETVVEETVTAEPAIIVTKITETIIPIAEKTTGFLPSPTETFSDTIKGMKIVRDGVTYPIFGTKINDGVVHYQIATIYKRDGVSGTVDSSATQNVALIVVTVKEGHGGAKEVLYRTYQESAFAKEATEIASHSAGVAKRLKDTYEGELYIDEYGNVSEKPFKIGDLVAFQLTGFGVVIVVLAGMWLFMSLISWALNKSGLAKTEVKKSAVPAKAAALVSPVGAKTIHPGLSDEKFIAILSAAATHALGGQAVNVVKFKPLNNMDWTWAIQGRVQSQSK